MNLDFVPTADFGVAATAEVMARGFADYLVKIPATAATLYQMARGDSVDLAASRVVRHDGVAVGAALIARRGWSCRLAGMALVPEARRSGIGRALVTHVLAEAAARGERVMELEVIEQNEPAVKLYEGCGFARIRRLVGFSRVVPESDRMSSTLTLEEVDIRSVGALVSAHGPVDMPWQFSGETIAHMGPPAVAYHADGAWLVCTDPTAAQVAVRALVTRRELGGDGRAGALLRAAMAKHPGREWRVGAIWPEEMADVFVAAGWTRTALSQWQMRRATG